MLERPTVPFQVGDRGREFALATFHLLFPLLHGFVGGPGPLVDSLLVASEGAFLFSEGLVRPGELDLARRQGLLPLRRLGLAALQGLRAVLDLQP